MKKIISVLTISLGLISVAQAGGPQSFDKIINPAPRAEISAQRDAALKVQGGTLSMGETYGQNWLQSFKSSLSKEDVKKELELARVNGKLTHGEM